MKKAYAGAEKMAQKVTMAINGTDTENQKRRPYELPEKNLTHKITSYDGYRAGVLGD